MIKVVYFDEGSATDYLTIKNGGSLITENQALSKKSHKENAQAGAGIKSLFDFLFLKGNIKAEIGIDLSNIGEKLIKTTISNTILSDFLDTMSRDKSNDIKELSGFKVFAVESSIAYFQTIIPYLRMAEGDVNVDEQLKFKINEVYDTFKSSKGYYELMAINESDKTIKKVFRFNNNSFKNNYSICDLEKMNFIYYGVKVGAMKESELNFNNLFSDSTEEIAVSIDEESRKIVDDYNLDVFDIILAGVKSNE